MSSTSASNGTEECFFCNKARTKRKWTCPACSHGAYFVCDKCVEARAVGCQSPGCNQIAQPGDTRTDSDLRSNKSGTTSSGLAEATHHASSCPAQSSDHCKDVGIRVLEQRVADLELHQYQGETTAKRHGDTDVPHLKEVVFRNGRPATVMKVDYEMKPPSIVLLMHDTMQEVNTELFRIERISTRRMDTTQHPLLCLLGEVGVGKSSLAALIAGLLKRDEHGNKQSSLFPVSNRSQPCTLFSIPQWCKWLGHGEAFQLIDAPGLGIGQDDMQLGKLVKILKDKRFISCFVLVFNAEQVRFTEQHRRMLQLFQDAFGGSFFGNLAVVFTHWALDKKSIKRRGSRDETFVREELLSSFKSHLKMPLPETALQRLPVFFLDLLFDEEDDEEQAAVMAEVSRFYAFILAQVPFDCSPFSTMRPQQPGLRERRQTEGVALNVIRWELFHSLELDGDAIQFFQMHGASESIRLLPWETFTDLKEELRNSNTAQSSEDGELLFCCKVKTETYKHVISKSLTLEIQSSSKPIGDSKHEGGIVIIPADVCPRYSTALLEFVRLYKCCAEMGRCYMRKDALLSHPELGLFEFLPQVASHHLKSLSIREIKTRLQEAGISTEGCIEKSEIVDVAARHACVTDAPHVNFIKFLDFPAKLSIDFEDWTYTQDVKFEYNGWSKPAKITSYYEMHNMYNTIQHFELPAEVATPFWKCLNEALTSDIRMYGVRQGSGYFSGSWCIHLTEWSKTTSWVEDGDRGSSVPDKFKEYVDFLSQYSLFLVKSESGPG